MSEPGNAQDRRTPSRFFTKRWRVILTIVLVIVVLLGGIAYSQRHQIHQFLQALTLPPTQPAQVTPLTLPSSTAISSATPDQSNNTAWTMYHYDSTRSGYIAGAPDPTSLTSLWQQPLDGAVYAEPLVINGRVIVATENDTLYSLDPRSGKVLWRTNVGTPVPLSDLPCGNIDPLGITGTPVYDPQTGLVYAVAEIQGPAHILVGLDVNTGQVKVRRLADPTGADARAQQQRGALGYYGGRIYIVYGGLDGDCSDYHGYVVAARDDGTGSLIFYQVPSPREAGIWSTPGVVIDAQGNLYVTVGNGAVTQGAWDHSDSVLRLSPTLQLEDAFAPQSWQSENAGDVDLGSMGPVLLPGGLLFAAGKSGQGYLLNANHLGGIGGQLQALSVCGGGAYGGAAASGQMIFVPCANGVRQVKIQSGSSLVVGWQAGVAGSPIVGGNTVYSLDVGGGVLYALDAATGATRARISVGTASHFATPTLYGTTIFVGTMAGVVAVSIHS